MGKSRKRFKEYIEENDFPKAKGKKESRHNMKEHLKQLIDHEDWDELEDERYEIEHSNHSR